MVHFDEILKTEAFGQTVLPDRSLFIEKWWKIAELKNSNETFWVIFKQCASSYFAKMKIAVPI